MSLSNKPDQMAERHKDLGRYPEWVVLHIPHDSVYIPPHVMPQFAVSEAELQHELLLMTDHHTHDLFGAGHCPNQVVRANVSRLVVDVERFADDAMEPMSVRGMGVIYTKTANQELLRQKLSEDARKALLENYYHPHHTRLEAMVEEKLARFGQCLVLDCHSFPSSPLPYEPNQDPVRPDICIGTDPFHTPDSLRGSFVSAFEAAGYKVRLDSPFSGALVPLKHYRKDPRVKAVMVEINRSLYMNEETGSLLECFERFSNQVSVICQRGCSE